MNKMNKQPRVYNKRLVDSFPKEAVYIGRPTKWGNPFRVNPLATIAEFQLVVKKYREYILSNPELLAAARLELAGKDLVCWCWPKPCHGDVLLEISNAPEGVQ